MADLVERIWNGPFDALLPDLSRLRIGETYQVTEEQAQSGHWLDPNAPADTPAPAPASPPPSPSLTFTSPSTPPAEGAES